MKKIYVGNLNYSVTESALHSLFEAYGRVASVTVVKDRDTGQPRGFAFVEMLNDAEAHKAMDGLNGRDLEGRTLTINEARPKAEGFGGTYRRRQH